MYPDCPYQDAWKPGMPLGTRAGGAMPGPIDPTHVAPAGSAPATLVGAAPAAASDAITMTTATTGRITMQLCAMRAVMGTPRA
jgi:hypothetical protein